MCLALCRPPEATFPPEPALPAYTGGRTHSPTVMLYFSSQPPSCAALAMRCRTPRE